MAEVKPGATSRVLTRAIVIGLAPWVFLAAVALAGVDFGRCWDDGAAVSKVRLALTPPVTLLPFAYDYPGAPFLLTLAAIAPEALSDPNTRRKSPDTSSLLAFADSAAYRLRIRRVFLAVSSLAVFWTAGAALAIGATNLEAFFAAAIFATSWEITYHVRWIAPDGMLMQFAAAAALCGVLAIANDAGRQSSRVLIFGAIAAGLATASKYSAWPAVAPIAVAAWFATGGPSLGRVWRVIKLSALSVLTFFLVSPGTLLQPTLAVSEMRAQVVHYSTGHGIYTVSRGADHLARLLMYVGTVLMSPNAWMASAVAVAAAIGAYALSRETPRTALCLMVFPASYAFYLGLQRAMIVRNLMALAPFVAVLAARGGGALWRDVRRTRWSVPLHSALVALAVLVVIANGWAGVSATESIRHRSDERTRAEFVEWLSQQPQDAVELSDRLRAELGINAPAPRRGADVAMYALDAHHEGILPNGARTFTHVFGPREVNLNYYPDWIGDAHIVVLPREAAIGFGVVPR
jgi:hypothetical protein